MYPSVSLENFSLDETLARRLPRQLAYYHLALPIGIDVEEGITVAMAQPDNLKAHEIIQNALSQPIIPVKSEAEQIRRWLDAIWQYATPVPWLQIAASSDDAVLNRYAHQFADIYGCPIIESAESDTENTLLIQPFPKTASLTFSGSTLLVNRLAQPIARMLHLVRVHTPDQVVISSLIPLAAAHASEITLLPDTEVTSHNLAYLLDQASPPGKHLDKLRQQLSQAGINGILRLRQEAFISAIATELADHQYDLVAVAADAYGEIARMLTDILRPHHIPAVLVIKPAVQQTIAPV